METVQQSSTVAALDIGSEKIAVAVADASEGGELTLLGFGKVPSLGIQHGSVQDVELAVESIRAAIAEAEQTSRRKVTTVSVALTGKHLHSINKVGQLVLPDAEVDSAAVKRVTRLAMAFDPKVEGQSQDDRLVSHVVKGYTLDNDDVMIDDPIGRVGSVIKAHVHLAIGSDSVVQNLVKCIRRAGLDIEGLVLQPWASAAGVLTPTDKELGVVVLDIGAGTTDISCWEKGQVEFTAVAAMGGNTIQRDIAAVLGCNMSDAEDIKLTYGHWPLRQEDAYETVRYMRESTGEPDSCSCEKIVMTVESRLTEMFKVIARTYLSPDGWNLRASAGIVLTGGVARMPGIAELAHHILGLPVRVGMPLMQSDASIGLVSPEDATVVGVLTETVRRRRLSGAEKRSDGTFSGLLAQLKRIVFGDFSG